MINTRSCPWNVCLSLNGLCSLFSVNFQSFALTVASWFSGTGCLEDTSVMKLLIRHLKEVKLNRTEDVLFALKVSLHARSMLPTYEVTAGAINKILMHCYWWTCAFLAPSFSGQ